MQLPEEISGLLSNSSLELSGALNGVESSVQSKGQDDSVAAVAAVYNHTEGSGEGGRDAAASKRLLETLRQEGINRTVHLRTIYVTGEEVQTLTGQRPPEQLTALVEKHPGWTGWISREGDLWLERRVNDLSPLTKKEAYIGVDEFGNLSLFKGPPASDKVLKTFFQMDMGSLKSSLPEGIMKQLHEGIRVQDIEEYNSVLSTFSDYARDTAEQAMQSKQ